MQNMTMWWGDFSIAQKNRRVWTLGLRCIAIQRLAGEWSIWNVEASEESDEMRMHSEDDSPVLFDNQFLSRHLQTPTRDSIRIMPALADRSIVARPNVPLHLLGGEKAYIYVSTPVWFTFMTLPDEAVIFDVPIWRPSDSWFGTSTMKGELCYAKYTDARLQLSLLERRSHRAITPICIQNNQNEVLKIERLNVPVPLLSLYRDAQGQLWTDTLTLTSEHDDDTVELHLEKQAPKEADNAIFLNKPRLDSEKNRFVRAIGSLFS